MRNFILTVLLGSIFGLGSFSRADIPVHETKIISPLRFTNRAQCAIDSETPTSSVLLMIDGYNAGKTAHSLAKLANLEPNQYSNRGMKEFRLAVTYLTLDIMNKMIRGQLPVLPVDFEKTTVKGFADAAKKCAKSVNCPEINNYLASVWNNSGSKQQLLRVDNFSAANFPLHTTKDQLGCYYIKKFSALQGHLHNPEVTQANLQDVALAYLNDKDYITGCFDADDSLDSRFATIQIDWSTNPQSLQKQGFAFWNSLKIYLAWAWRHSNELSQISPTFARVFRSIALEESIMFSPNGCRSMAPPSCDSEYLANNSIRELAKINNESNEHSANVPSGTDKEMLEKGVRGVNNDFLGTQSFDNAQAWLSHFRKNLVQNRGLMKSKYQAAIQNLSFLQQQLGAAQMKSSLATVRSQPNSEQIANELYYLCTETRLAADGRIDFLKSDIERIGELKNMLRLQQSEKYSLAEHINFFRQVTSQTLPLCDELEKVRYWERANYTVNRSGFSNWAKEILQLKDEPGAAPFTPTIFNNSPELSWQNSTAKNQIICANPMDCQRLLLKSMVDLYSVATYADALVPLAGTAASPSLFNPYSELNSCKMYDPWFQSKRMKNVFLADLASTALFGWNFLPVYVDANYSAPKVASFNQLVQDGVIKFDPRLERSKLERSLVADFGPLVGAPCAVSMNNNGLKLFDFYSFSGITLNYCDSKQSNEVIAQKPSDMISSPSKGRTVCAGCTINFVAVGSAASSATLNTLNPVKFVVYLFRAFTKLHDAKKDKVNLPKAWEVNPAYVAEVYKRFGKIPEHCVEQLGKGLRCYQNLCSAQIASAFERNFKAKVSDIYLSSSEKGRGEQAWIKSELCKGEVIVPFRCDELNDEKFVVDFNKAKGFSQSCKNAVGR